MDILFSWQRLLEIGKWHKPNLPQCIKNIFTWEETSINLIHLGYTLQTNLSDPPCGGLQNQKWTDLKWGGKGTGSLNVSSFFVLGFAIYLISRDRRRLFVHFYLFLKKFHHPSFNPALMSLCHIAAEVANNAVLTGQGVGLPGTTWTECLFL